MKNRMISIVRLSDANLDDIKQLVKLDRNAIENYGNSYSIENWNVSNFVYKLPKKCKYSFIFKVKNIIVGFCIASLKNKSIYIHRFLVKKNPDNLAKVFFRNLLVKYSDKNIVLMVNNHNESAISFYKYFNFQFENNEKVIKQFISNKLIVKEKSITIKEDYQCYLMIRKK